MEFILPPVATGFFLTIGLGIDPQSFPDSLAKQCKTTVSRFSASFFPAVTQTRAAFGTDLFHYLQTRSAIFVGLFTLLQISVPVVLPPSIHHIGNTCTPGAQEMEVLQVVKLRHFFFF